MARLLGWLGAPVHNDAAGIRRAVSGLSLALSFTMLGCAAWLSLLTIDLAILRVPAHPLLPFVALGEIGLCSGLLFILRARAPHATRLGLTVYPVSLLATVFGGAALAGHGFDAALLLALPGFAVASLGLSRRRLVLLTACAVCGIALLTALWLEDAPALAAQSVLIRNAAAYSALFVMVGGAAIVVREQINALRESHHRDARQARLRSLQLTQMLDVSRNMSASLQLGPTLAQIVEGVRATLPNDALAILEYVERNWYLVLAHHGEIPAANLSAGLHFDLARDLDIAEMLRTRQPVIIDDVRADTLLARAWQARLARETAGDSVAYPGALAPAGRTTDALARGSVMLVPMAVRSRVSGAIIVHRRQTGMFHSEHARQAQQLAAQAAIALANVSAHRDAVERAALDERNRIARELHDSIAQSLYGISLAGKTLSDPAISTTPLAQQAGKLVAEESQVALSELRTMVCDLMPEAIEQGGLVQAIQKQAAAFGRRSHVSVHLTLCQTEPDLDARCKEMLYRITQEALNNVARHAQAARVDIELTADDKRVWLSIRDDGKGFDPTQPHPGHFGLRSMHARAQQIGGHLSIYSTPGRGTGVHANVPAR